MVDKQDEFEPTEQDLYRFINEDHSELVLYRNFIKELGELLVKDLTAEDRLMEIQGLRSQLKYRLGKADGKNGK